MPDRCAHDLRQFAGGADRGLPPGRGDRPRDAPGEALFAEPADQLGQLVLGKLRDEVGGARPILSHAHVERAVEAKREATLGAVELLRGNAEIERDPGDRVGRCRADQLIHVAEAAFDQRQPTGELGGESRTAPHCLGIAVDAEDPATRRGQQPRAVAAAAEGAIDIGFAVAWRECRQHRLEQDRDMVGTAR